MAVELNIEHAPEPRPVLTPRGQAVVLVIGLEELWPSLDAADRAYVAPALEQLAREAKAAE